MWKSIVSVPDHCVFHLLEYINFLCTAKQVLYRFIYFAYGVLSRLQSCDLTPVRVVTHISLASLFGDVGKQCRHRSDPWSGSALFANRKFYLK